MLNLNVTARYSIGHVQDQIIDTFVLHAVSVQEGTSLTRPTALIKTVRITCALITINTGRPLRWRGCSYPLPTRLYGFLLCTAVYIPSEARSASGCNSELVIRTQFYCQLNSNLYQKIGCWA